MIDPQRFFEQFDPSLYFVDPKPSSLEGCFIIAEQIVPSGRQAFSKTIKRWTLEPQFAIPPIDKAEIKSTLENNNVEIVVRALIPKRKTKDAVLNEKVEWMETDQESRVMYTPMVETKQDIPYYYPKVKSYSFVYTFAQEEEQVDQDTGLLRLEIMPFDSKEAAVTDPKMQYALKTILHKLFKWCIQARLGYKKKAHHDVLVPKETYQSMYQYLKTKYGPHLVSHWTEKTDPKKFVYEDIAIASYLICLWKEEEAKTKRAQTFIDLGCGNGLLTFLLVSEGYEGYGLDIADRKIWTSLCKTKDMLRVKTLYPAKASFPGTDWLIGNHADELVPWIPIIAQKSGENCKFMIIPCCFYGLDGTRSLSLSPTEGKYRAYTDYIKDIASQAGFACEEDYLRIPSTKNIAILGRTRKQDVQGNQLTQSIAVASEAFVPRKTDREKEKTRQEACKKLKTG
ncbi:uncharacterized protein B0P05DRAFT_530999 [Gilbertella persicaria]|uniref:tRNA (uracil-O(2)-)-methyltransferase n=1 Tax=Rhizopus stolonifer TaxID=4846 RepID=A0A367KSZ2_RHIST|nr:uncharacterized protein B0P05DRAFT_530999 [Gilbertella persicaria]KAI8087992.1 hypothetical protein B0P05DRAFT_530999 [Gilbertella persicaria]RCI05311.1 tRNA methyltransferase 44 [Rhizopus stolonifer]